MTDDFKAQFAKFYGYSFAKKQPDYTRCAQSVHERGRGVGSYQCARKNGYGPHGAWCKQHDPEARKAKRDAKYAEWKTKLDMESRHREFRASCEDAIRKIAAGHNDPRGLAQSIIDKLEGNA